MKTSSGILAYRFNPNLEVLLGHPGGPYYTPKWGIPKGEVEEDESLFETALREFNEETGCYPQGEFIDLGSVSTNKKHNHIWAVEWDCDINEFHSNYFTMEYPSNSGELESFPELDEIKWFSIEEAFTKLFDSQIAFLIKLEELLK